MRLLLLIAITLSITFIQLKADTTELAVELIKQHEGYRDKPYKDTRGNWTVGYGTNMGHITKDEATFLLHYRLNKADMHLSLEYDWYNNLPYIPRSIIQDMVYNMGQRGFSKFRKMHTQLARGNWVKAALEMKSSLWYTQTKSRSSKLFNLMLNYK